MPELRGVLQHPELHARYATDNGDFSQRNLQYLPLLMLYTNGQKFSTKVVKYVLSSSTYGRHLTRFLINHLLTNLEHLTLTPTYLDGYALT